MITSNIYFCHKLNFATNEIINKGMIKYFKFIVVISIEK